MASSPLEEKRLNLLFLFWPAVRSLKTIQKEKMTIIRSILHFGKEICDVLIKISTIKNYMLIMFKTIKTLAM